METIKWLVVGQSVGADLAYGL